MRQFVKGAAGAAAMLSGVLVAGGAAAQDAAPVDPAGAVSGKYKSDPGHAYISFTYLHQGYSRPILRWRDWTGELDWNADDPTKSKLNVEIDAASIDSGVDKFDAHLKSADFFEVEKHPKITFKSTKLTTTGPNTGELTGDLTIKGETKPVTLDVTLNRAADDDFAKAHKLGFSATGEVKRTDFGVGKYAPFVGDEVTLTVEAEFVNVADQQEAAAAE
ncbi:MAG: YceI family protein [Parvularculaceae bacterium]